MRAEHSVNLQKRVLPCGFATTAAVFCTAQKMSTSENHSKLSGLTTMRRMTRGRAGWHRISILQICDSHMPKSCLPVKSLALASPANQIVLRPARATAPLKIKIT
jgi:hypothetical protein